MACLSTASAKQPATAGDHQTDKLRKAVTFVSALALLTFNSGLAIHQSLDDIESVAVSYLALVLLFAWRLGFCERRHDARQLKAAIWFLILLLALLLGYKAAGFESISTSALLVAVAGGAAMGTCCTLLLLHRDGWFNRQRQEVLVLPLPELP